MRLWALSTLDVHLDCYLVLRTSITSTLDVRLLRSLTPGITEDVRQEAERALVRAFDLAEDSTQLIIFPKSSQETESDSLIIVFQHCAVPLFARFQSQFRTESLHVFGKRGVYIVRCTSAVS